MTALDYLYNGIKQSYNFPKPQQLLYHLMA